jgi:hypothetical protein
MKVLQGKTIWLRKSSVMNDFMEIEYGLKCLNAAHKTHLDRFTKLLDGMFPGFSKRLIDRFNAWLPNFRTDTYIVCFSEHDESEDFIGRLSMWRAYGQNTGVAIVFNGGPFLRPTNALKAYSSPVAYLTVNKFDDQFVSLLDRIENEAGYLRDRGEELVSTQLFSAFRYAILCTKHPGFHEEREWRVIHSPTFQHSERIATDVVTINGVPQPVCKISLQDVPEEGLTGLEIPSLVDRIIIGPTEYPNVIREAFMTELFRAGMSETAKRIIVSDIPLRR